jgi:phosphomannomutase
MDESFTVENVKIVAQAIAKHLSSKSLAENGVVISYDTRANAKEFAQICSQVMSGNKIPVYLTNRAMPTPITAFTITSQKAAGAIMITASHNPPEYNGIKFIPEYAGPANPEITADIVKNISQLCSRDVIEDKNNRLAKLIDPVPEYLEYLKKLVDFDTLRTKKLKIVLDPMYGAGYGIINTVFEKTGCEVTAIHNYADSSFGGCLPDPCLENLEKLKISIKENNADLGLALDGDGDRFGAIDSSGEYIRANKVLALLSLHLIKNRGFKGILARSIATTHLLDAIAKEHDIELYETPNVGFKFIAEVALKKPVILGGEESGGLCIKGSIPEKDGILADLLLAEMMAYENKPLLKLLEEIHQKYGYFVDERLDIKFPLEKKESLLDTLIANPPDTIANQKLEDITTTDGVRYTLEDGDWILIRPSGTEPLVRIYLESKSKERFQQLKAYAQEIIDSA